MLISAFLLAATAVASAQTAPQRPTEPAPTAGAPFERREAWCAPYVAWFVASTPIEGPLPPDVRPTQRYEDEFAYCKLDPQQYQRDTSEELARAPAPKSP